MGWTGIHYEGNVVDYCNTEIWADHCEVLASSKRGNIVYQAIRNNKEGNVFAGVILISMDNKDYFNFHYKVMSENSGPCGTDCPKKILNLLTPTDSEWANEWRAKQNKKTSTKLQEGDKVEFDDEISFCDGSKHKTFIVTHYYKGGRKHIGFMANGELYNISGYTKLKYRVIKE